MRFNIKVVYLLLGVGILFGIVSTFMLLQNNTNTDSNADTISDAFPTSPPASVQDGTTPTVQPTGSSSCATPSQIQNVHVVYPGCDENDVCQFTQASCSWDSEPTAASYSIKITEVDTDTSSSQTATAGSTKILFPVTNGKTYKCEVSAVNACNNIGPAGADQQLCQTENPTIPVSPTVEVPTTAPDVPTTAPDVPTATPTLPPTGPQETLIAGAVFGALLITIGGLLFLL